MWTLWLTPMVAILLAGAIVLSVLVWGRPRAERRRSAIAACGCIAIPTAAIALLALLTCLWRESDAQLYEEIFGYRPQITEDRMLFDDFGSGSERQIYMRAEPSTAERKRLMAIPRSAVASFTLDDFISDGVRRGFIWWISQDRQDRNFCDAFRLFDASGSNGWSRLWIVECVRGGAEFPASANAGLIYVIASRAPA